MKRTTSISGICIKCAYVNSYLSSALSYIIQSVEPNQRRLAAVSCTREMSAQPASSRGVSVWPTPPDDWSAGATLVRLYTRRTSRSSQRPLQWTVWLHLTTAQRQSAALQTAAMVLELDQYSDGKAARLWTLYIGDQTERTRHYKQFLKRELNAHCCDTVLDVACGTG